MPDRPQLKLGERLIQDGKITKPHLDVALQEQRKTGEMLGKILMRMGFITQADLSSALLSQSGADFIDLKNIDIDPVVLKFIPQDVALKKKVLPLAVKNGKIQVGMANPLDIMTLDELRKMTRMQVEAIPVNEEDLLNAIHELYFKNQPAPFRRDAGSEDFEAFLEDSVQRIGGSGLRERPEELTDTGSVIALVDRIIHQAIRSDATDIHIEPDEEAILVRYRIDGILSQFSTLPKNLQSAVTTRIKIMANMNISENRLPQDGRAEFDMDGRKIDIRLSTFPCVAGENIVLRLLDKARLILGLEQLGFTPQVLPQYQEIIHRQNGVILVTGPTGSGKTTTLYATIAQLNAKEQNIITLEDPVEYNLPMIRQSQINLRAGLTFAGGLRAILRQDPDIILVGEIRDHETMEMAMRAALTGHLVFSTLHTNDAAGAIPRLLDMGAEAYLLASSLIAILSQRLVRSICPHCKEPDTPDPILLAKAGWKGKGMKLQRGKGCPRCNQTGYRGRIGIFELLMVSPRVKNLVVERKDSKLINETAREEGMITLLEDGLQKVLQGITTLDEVLRVV